MFVHIPELYAEPRGGLSRICVALGMAEWVRPFIYGACVLDANMCMLVMMTGDGQEAKSGVHTCVARRFKVQGHLLYYHNAPHTAPSWYTYTRTYINKYIIKVILCRERSHSELTHPKIKGVCMCLCALYNSSPIWDSGVDSAVIYSYYLYMCGNEEKGCCRRLNAQRSQRRLSMSAFSYSCVLNAMYEILLRHFPWGD